MRSLSRVDQSKRKRRSIGRPAAGEERVGREALVDKTCELLRTLPPNRVTRAEVARYTNVDPSLIRYYFRDRSSLLVAAAQELTARFLKTVEEESAKSDGTADGRLRACVAAHIAFEIDSPFFHRLLVEEVVTSRTPAAKKLLNEITEKAIGMYESILNAGSRQGTLRRVDPVLLFITIAGICEFFVSGQPIIEHASGKKVDPAALGSRYRDLVSGLLLEGLLTPAARSKKARARA